MKSKTDDVMETRTRLYWRRMPSSLSAAQRDARKTCAWGIGWILVACVWLFSNFGANLVDDFRLMLYGRTTTGEVFDSYEDVQDGDDGRPHWSSSVAYRFKHPDGRVIQGSSGSASPLPEKFADVRRRPVPVEIEYIPSDPAVNRLKVMLSGTIGEWLIRIGAFVVLLVAFVGFGVRMVLDGIAEWRRATANQQSIANHAQLQEISGPTNFRSE